MSNWFDSGVIKGFRIPGSQDRRIPIDTLIQFLVEHNMPLGELEDEALSRVLVVTEDEHLFNAITIVPDVVVFRAESLFAAGTQYHQYRPGITVFDLNVGRYESMQAAAWLAREYAPRLIIAVNPEDSDKSHPGYKHFDEVYQRPFPVGMVGDRIRRAKGNRKNVLSTAAGSHPDPDSNRG